MNTRSKTQTVRPTHFDPAKYEAFVREVRVLLGRDDLGEANLQAMYRDQNWFMCWSEGLTPEQAVTEFRKVMN
jgi:hypothetical protein